MKPLFTALIWTACAFGQTGRTVKVTWQDAVNPSGTTYNVYRAPAACSNLTADSVRLNTAPVAVKEYLDSNVQPGVYCYFATAVSGGAESDRSNSKTVEVKAAEPTGLAAERQ